MTTQPFHSSRQPSTLEAFATALTFEENHPDVSKKTVKKNEPVYLPGSASGQIYFVVSGRVKLVRHYNTDKQIIKTLITEGEVFGEFSLLGQPTRKEAAIAMESTELFVVNRSTIKKMMRDHPEFSFTMMKVLGNRLMEMEHRLETMVYTNSRSRVIDFLKRLVYKKGQRVGYEMLVRKFLTHQEIASLTATSRQTVTTVLNELRSKNILTFNRRRLLVRDMEMLIAEGRF